MLGREVVGWEELQELDELQVSVWEEALEEVKREFGTTDDFFKGIWILPDGSLVKGTRHLDIQYVFPYTEEDPFKLVQEFAERTGAIRYSITGDYKTYLFNLQLSTVVPPTYSQWSKIGKIAKDARGISFVITTERAESPRQRFARTIGEVRRAFEEE